MTNKAIIKRDQVFFENLMDGGGLVASANKAGYDSSEIYRVAMPALQTRFAHMAARMNMEAKLKFEAAPVAYKVMMEMLNDPTTPKNIRVDVAKYLHSVAGYNAPKAQEAPAPTKSDKDLNEMTTQELNVFISQSEQELKKRLIDVSPPQGIEDML